MRESEIVREGDKKFLDITVNLNWPKCILDEDRIDRFMAKAEFAFSVADKIRISFVKWNKVT